MSTLQDKIWDCILKGAQLDSDEKEDNKTAIESLHSLVMDMVGKAFDEAYDIGRISMVTPNSGKNYFKKCKTEYINSLNNI